MKAVFIIGPYRASTPRGIIENIRAAEAMAIEVWKVGAVALCPHLNTALMDGILPDEVWLAGALELLSRCDAAIVVPHNYGSSAGSSSEIHAALDKGLIVFPSIVELKVWLNEENSAKA